MGRFELVCGFGLAVVAGVVLCACQSAAEEPVVEPPKAPPPVRTEPPAAQGALPKFWVRPGYKVTLVASNLRRARFMEFDDKGTLHLTLDGSPDIMAMRLKNGRYERVNTFVSGYPSAHGMHFYKGWLWFTQSGAVHKGRDTNGDGKADEVVAVIPDGKLPKGGHWWRSILVTDDGFFTSIGDSGNINDETMTDRQKIWKYSLDGKTKKLWSAGIRNTEKLRFRPGTKEVWGADHGSDWFGGPVGDKQGRQPITDLNPPDEFNHYVEGGFYGHPFLFGNRVPRVEYQKKPDIIDWAEKTIPPAWSFGAHWATNGWTFLTKDHFPADHKGDAFVACHGSWNSKTPVGYRIERVCFDKVLNKPYGAQMVVGAYVDGAILGRPVDCVEAPDGTILFSDDARNCIYRLSYVGK